MRKKKVVVLVLLTVVIFVLGFYPVIGKTHSNNRDNNTLKIYLTGQGGRLNAVINKFQEKYPNIKIEKVLFDINEGDGIEGYVKKMLTDTLAGDGPDILLLDNMSTRKLQRSEMLLDLKPFMEKDKDFKTEDYNTKVIGAGLYKGKQVIMPLDYYVNQYITTEQLLESNNVKLENHCSEKAFMNALEGYIDKANEDKSKFLFATPMSIEDFIASSGEKFIDYDNKKVYFDKLEFKEIIENYKKIYNASKKKEDITGISGVDGFEDLKNGNTLFSNDPIIMNNIFFEYESLINQVLRETQIINTMPSYKGGGKVTAILGSSLAISKNTKNKEAAYNFIKIAISEDIQSSRDLPQYIPINKKAARELENQYMKNEVNGTYGYSKDITVVKQPISKNFQSYFNKIVDNVDAAQITNFEIEQVMMECFTPYFMNRLSYETCERVLSNKIKLYLNE